MCTFRCINRIRNPLYTNTKYAYFSTTERSSKPYEAINMSYNLYEGAENIMITMNAKTPPLIVMHGLFGSKANWNSLCKALQRNTLPQRTILSVDARNHGDSPHSSNHSYEHLAEDVRTLYSHLDIKKATLLGHSMGGRVMMYFALKYPDLVDKLIVGDISPISTSPSLNSMQEIFNVMENVKFPSNIHISAARAELNKELSQSIDDQGLRSFLLTNLKQDVDGSYLWRINIEALRNNFVPHIAQFPQVDNLTYDGPVLFLIGENSNFVRETDYPRILKLYPNAVFKTISGAGHWLHSEKPAEFLELSLKFLNT